MRNEISNLNEKRKKLDKYEIIDRIKVAQESKADIMGKQITEFISLKITEVNYYLTRGKPMTFLIYNSILNDENLFNYDKKYFVSNKQVRLNLKNETDYGMGLLRELKERFYFDQITNDKDFSCLYEQVYFFLASKIVMNFNEYLYPECFHYNNAIKTYVLNGKYHLSDIDDNYSIGLFFIYRDLSFIQSITNIFSNVIKIIIENSKNFAEVNIEEINDKETYSAITTSWIYSYDKDGLRDFHSIADVIEHIKDELTTVKKVHLIFLVKKDLLLGTVNFEIKFELTLIPHTLARCDKIKVTSRSDPNNFVFFQENSHIKIDENYNNELILSKDNLKLIRKIVSNDSD